MRTFVSMLVLALASCGSGNEAPKDPAEDLKARTDITIVVSPGGTPERCAPAFLTYTGRDTPLYMFNSDKIMMHKDGGMRTKIPSQVKFSSRIGLDVRREESASLSNYDVPCADMIIRWEDLECISDDREKVACPAIRLQGGEAFAGLEIENGR